MRAIAGMALLAMLAAWSTGCARTSIAGHGNLRTNQFFGNLGITGDGNNVTIEDGSKVTKLSILGNNNTVTVEDGANLYRIEFWGKGNIVSVPEYLAIRATEVGTNQIIRRKPEFETTSEWPDMTTPSDPWAPQPEWTPDDETMQDESAPPVTQPERRPPPEETEIEPLPIDEPEDDEDDEVNIVPPPTMKTEDL